MCLAHYYLLAGNLSNPSLYPTGCLPATNDTPETAEEIDTSEGYVLIAPTYAIRWWVDEQEAYLITRTTVADVIGDNWTLNIYSGPNVAELEMVGTLTPGTLTTAWEGVPGGAIYYELLTLDDNVSLEITTVDETNKSCDTALSLDTSAGGTVELPEQPGLWWEDTQTALATQTTTVSDPMSGDWLVRVFTGTDCEGLALAATLTPDEPSATWDGTPGDGIWYQVLNQADASELTITTEEVSNATCDTALSLDTTTAGAIAAPAGSTRWWRDTRNPGMASSTTASNVIGGDWTVEIYQGFTCSGLGLTTTLTPTTLFQSYGGSPTASQWYKLTTGTDAVSMDLTSSF